LKIRYIVFGLMGRGGGVAILKYAGFP